MVRSATALLDNDDGQARSRNRRRLTREVRGRASLARAILSAGRATGVSPAYLWRTAHRESGLNPAARAQGSSAFGLFQFVERTWLEVVTRHGGKHGIAIASRADLLALREDAAISALMAGELAGENRRALERALGRAVSDEDLYVAHFLGPTGAVRLIRAARFAPHRPAVHILPAAARANPDVFFSRQRALTCRQLLERLRHG